MLHVVLGDGTVSGCGDWRLVGAAGGGLDLASTGQLGLAGAPVAESAELDRVNPGGLESVGASSGTGAGTLELAPDY